MPAQRNHRPWLAALLAIVQPGLGHVYLREWVRALTWFALWLATLLLVVPVSSNAGAGVVETVGAILTAVDEAPLAGRLALLAVTAFSTFDAYWLAANAASASDVVNRCPNCGKEVDESLEFCHWCTEPLTDERAQ